MSDFEKFLAAVAGIGAIAGFVSKVRNNCAVIIDTDTLAPATTKEIIEYSYGAAVSAIYESDMMSTAKSMCIDRIQSAAPSDYYKAIIAVVKNYNFGSEVISAIDSINKSFKFA